MIDTGQKLGLTVVVPVYSGEAYLADLLERLGQVRLSWRSKNVPCDICEVIFVDDSAIDGSGSIVDELAEEHTWVTALHLARNYGQHAATTAGILHSSGDWIITMDEDLQHPPEEILEMLEHAILSRSDVVYASPEGNVHKSMYRDMSSRTFKFAMKHMTGNKELTNANSFRLIRGDIARASSSVCIHDTYYDVVLNWFTNRFSTKSMSLKDFRHIETGKSGYSFKSLISHARRMLTSSHVKILRLGALMGGALVTTSIVAFLYILIRQLVFPEAVDVAGWVSLMLVNLLIGGVLISLVGIILEYLATLVQRAHGKPVFFIVDRSSDSILKEYFTSES